MNTTERLSHWAVIVIAVIAFFAALDVLESIFAPLALALVAGVVLSPLSDFWERRGYSSVIGALIGLTVTTLVLASLALIFQPIIAQLVEQAPKVWQDMQGAVKVVRGLLKGLSDATSDVSDAIAPEANAAPPQASADQVALPSVTDALMVAPAILSQLLIFGGALFFFLLTRREIYSWATKHRANPAERLETEQRLRQAERLVSRYFVTITLINAGLGVATAMILQAIGMPGAILWGVVSFLMNFVVYLGPAVFAVALLFAGIATFDGGLALVPAVSFVVLNTLEGQFVTPALVGRNMAINPLLVFLSLVFGIWLWGPIGGIVAIPLLLWVLVLNDGLRQPPMTDAG